MENNQDLVVMKVTEAQNLFTFKREKGNVIINSYKGKDTDVVIPQIIGKSPVTGSNKCAFQNRPDLASMTIPASVTDFGPYVFEDCEALTIHAPAGSAAEEYAKKNGIKFEVVEG